MLPLILLLGTSLAHPLGMNEWSLRTGLHAGDKGLTALVVGEVPVSVVAKDLRLSPSDRATGRDRVDRYTAARQRELIEGSELRINGVPQSVTWLPAPSRINGKAVDGFFVYAVVAVIDQADLPEQFEANLRNRAWLDADVVLAADIRSDGPWSRLSTNGPVAWGRDARPRDLKLEVQLRGVVPGSVSPEP